jgi:hypothetical protein
LENKIAKTNNIQENEISVSAETVTDSENSKVNKKNGIILQKYKVTNTRETAHFTETLKQKSKESEDTKMGKTSTTKINTQSTRQKVLQILGR